MKSLRNLLCFLNLHSFTPWEEDDTESGYGSSFDRRICIHCLDYQIRDRDELLWEERRKQQRRRRVEQYLKKEG